jgi:hypothetical protein
MEQELTCRQICVRSTINCVALAVAASLVLAVVCRTGATFALTYIGDLLVVTALAQGVLSWLTEICGDDNGARGILLGGLSSLITGGMLLLASVLL